MQDPSTFQPMMKPHFPEQEQLKCPRCESTNTKFCYYNNYNLSQPRHFCKNCKRYWTKGGALRNIPVGGGTRKSTKRSSKRSAPSSSPSPSPSPSPSVSSSLALPATNGSDPTRVHATRVDQDQGGVMNIGGSFSSLLGSNGHFGGFLEGLNSSGSGLKMVHMGEFGVNLGSDPVVSSGTGRNPGLEMQSNGGNSENFMGMQNGDSSCWNGNHGWSDLAIYTPGSSFQ